MKLSEIIQVIMSPSCWIRMKPTSKAWDKELNVLIEKCEPKLLNAYEMKLGDYTIWISNFPYWYGEFAGLLPSRVTVFRLRKLESTLHCTKKLTDSEKLRKALKIYS
jgi:hypothetical protein